jgi:hypothetical protein
VALQPLRHLDLLIIGLHELLRFLHLVRLRGGRRRIASLAHQFTEPASLRLDRLAYRRKALLGLRDLRRTGQLDVPRGILELPFCIVEPAGLDV